jgi:ABC-type glycerol-3-phosphate transport system permease component
MKKQRVQWAPNLITLVVTMALLFPVFATLVISFKQQSDVVRKPPLLFPCDRPGADFDPAACRFFTEGYDRNLASKPDPAALLGMRLTGQLVAVYMPNTLLYAAVSSAIVAVFAAMAGYAFSRFVFPGRRALQTFILVLTGVPLLTNLIALYQMAISVRKTLAPALSTLLAGMPQRAISDNLDRAILILIYSGLFLPFSIWVIKSFFDAIPRDLEEAALIDGTTPFGALRKVIAPLAAPGIFSAFLLAFVGVWNEFITNYLLVGTTKPGLRSVVVGLYELTGANLINYQVLAAACVLVTVPVLLVFIAFRRTFFEAMTEGAVKG